MLKRVQTHNVAIVSTVADFVVSIGSGGRIGGQGTVQEVLGIEPQLAAQLQYDEEVLELVDDNEEKLSEEEKVQQGKLVMAEEVPVGHVSWRACAFPS